MVQPAVEIRVRGSGSRKQIGLAQEMG